MKTHWSWLGSWLAGLLLVGGLCLQPDVATAQNNESPPEALKIYEGAVNAQTGNAFELAAEEWGRFLTMFPKDPLAPKARYYEGVCYLQLRNWERAIGAFGQVLKDYPKFELREDAFVNLGWCQYSAAEGGQAELLPAAVKTFRGLLAEFAEGKHRDEALYFLGESLYLQENRQEAVTAYRELTEKHPKSKYYADGLYALGVAQEELGQFAAAGATYDSFLRDLPEHKFAAEVTMRKAECLLQTEAVAEAEELFGKVAAVPDFFAADFARMRRAYCLEKLDRFADAAALYAALVSDLPESKYVPEAEIAAARAFYRVKNSAAATKWLTATRQRGGENGLEAAHWQCRLFLQDGQSAEAEKLAAEVLPQAASSMWLVNLRFDHADALYEQPAKRPQALVLYLKIAEDHRDHRLAPQALYNAAIAAVDGKDFELGLQLGERFRQSHAADALAPDMRRVVVECLLQKREYARAQAELTQLAADFPEHPERNVWRVRLGVAYYLNREYPKAVAYLSPLVAQLSEPEVLAEAHYLIGASQFQQDQAEAAAQSLEASLKAAPQWRQADETQLFLARCRQKQERLDEAVKLTQDLIQKFPNSAILDQAWYRLGDFLYAQKKFAESRQAYTQAIDMFPQSTFLPYALFGRGWTELSSGEFAAAATNFSAVVSQHATHELADDAQFALGMARRQHGQFELAIADFAAFLKTNPPPPQKSDALYERGLAEVALKKSAEAVQTFTAILNDHPQYAKADAVRYELAWAHRTAGNEDQAVAEFAKLTDQHPTSPLAAEAHFHVGEQFYKSQKYPEAVTAYMAAKSGAATSELKEKTLYKLGWAHFQLEQFEPAYQVFAEQATNFPDGALAGDAGFMKGESLFKQAKYPEALTAFTAARQVKPSSEQMEMLILLHGGQAAAQVKQWAQSLDYLSSLLQKFPETPYQAEAHYERGWALQNTDKLEEAYQEYGLAAAATTAVGARARFMMGELRFTQKKFEDAVREFQRAMFLYGGDNAPAETKTWQAKAGYEAGRCAEVQIQSATTAQAKAEAIAEAKKFYTYVMQKHPQDALAAEAQKRLTALAKL